jgi:hypothetical protein
MAGILQGLAVDGRIPISIIQDVPVTLFGNLKALVPPAYYYREMGFNSDGELLVYTDIVSQEEVFYAGHLPVNGLGMVFGVEDVPQGYSQGATPINIGGSNVWPALVRCVMPLLNDLSFLVDQGAGASTFTRASPSASFINKSNGLMQYAAADTPRFETDGLLMEGESTNELLSSQAFAEGTPWIAFGGLVVDNNSTAPDGAETATLYQMATEGYIEQTADRVFAIGQWVTGSYFVQQISAEVAYIRLDTELGLQAGFAEFNFNTETFVVDNGVNTFSEKLDNGWFRIGLSYQMVSADKIRFRHGMSENPATPVGLNYCWGAQLETHSQASSYITTTVATVTRAQDVLTIPPANMTPTGNDYSIGITSNLLSVGSIDGQQNTWEADPATGLRRGYFRTTQAATVVGNGVGLSAFSPATNKGENNRVTSTYDVEGTLYVNQVAQDSEVTPTLDTGAILSFNIGQRASLLQPVYGHISNLRVYDAALTEEQIQIEETFLNIMPRLCYDLVGAVTHYHQGVPYTATGAIAVSGTVAPPTSSFSSGFSGDFS